MLCVQSCRNRLACRIWGYDYYKEISSCIAAVAVSAWPRKLEHCVSQPPERRTNMLRNILARTRRGMHCVLTNKSVWAGFLLKRPAFFAAAVRKLGRRCRLCLQRTLLRNACCAGAGHSPGLSWFNCIASGNFGPVGLPIKPGLPLVQQVARSLSNVSRHPQQQLPPIT